MLHSKMAEFVRLLCKWDKKIIGAGEASEINPLPWVDMMNGASFVKRLNRVIPPVENLCRPTPCRCSRPIHIRRSEVNFFGVVNEKKEKSTNYTEIPAHFVAVCALVLTSWGYVYASIRKPWWYTVFVGGFRLVLVCCIRVFCFSVICRSRCAKVGVCWS